MNLTPDGHYHRLSIQKNLFLVMVQIDETATRLNSELSSETFPKLFFIGCTDSKKYGDVSKAVSSDSNKFLSSRGEDHECIS